MSTDTENTLSSAASQFRQHIGLPDRESDAPTSDGEAPELSVRTEPEGGYGGKDGISNTGALNGSELANREQTDKLEAERAEKIEETGLSGGEPATQEAIVTGEDVADVKPAPETTAEEKAPAKKKAAKK
jgi:hypothetical protein